MKIFIRADGGKSIGLGHIMRMIVLGKELRKNNEVIFICRNSLDEKYSAGIKILKENKFQVMEVREKNYIEDIINIQKEHKADVIITDSYNVDEEYFKLLRRHFMLTGYVDDVNTTNMNVDFLINQNINASLVDYGKTTSSRTKLFLGTKYCMIREEFRRNSNEKIIKEEVKDILITLGGMDNDYNTKKVLELIKDCNKNIHVVLGSAFDKALVKEIYDLSKKYCCIFPYENANMSELMKKCDIAISACGSTIYELCAMKVPSIGVIIADNQEEVAHIMKEKELVLDVFSIKNINAEELVNSLNKLIDNKLIRKRIINNQKNIVNVNGARDLAKGIEKLANMKITI
ncbi:MULTISPECIES: UDP-2,4-diacetamido-2,4,6-trideoxy-beta-L-altropyranose hydrolase [unclassified Clostridium]|uniref:UDP-2,4-diacetamido-2,4, 6-trideoxy-beta-L-altropyranose hydrolase n=1 Tax=unclassified Clostridium TaxID=2614128 RepID=UPI000297F004|nr:MULTISPECIES: UDP-2,4-diacetamido-2,4,6-trideoxy-beta-L-altropyranose hydrolase [unclassified Clostridium]EKQ51098.1 MAG: pseudaminic acid biosynthesis-associated protein PseG [Clostridium sp. Maddingley MBC34-26]